MPMLHDHPLYFNDEIYKPIQYFLTPRPWLDLYGVSIRPALKSSEDSLDVALLHLKIPDELLSEIFARLPPYTLGMASCVCRKWRFTLRNPVFWRAACLKSWQVVGFQENKQILSQYYGGSWRKMWLNRPRPRFDGIYVSRDSYIRSGSGRQVFFFRYIRFFPSGRFLFRNSPYKPKDVAKSLNRRNARENIYGGRYTLTDDLLAGTYVYPGIRLIAQRIQLRIRGTIAGANNRLHMQSYDSGDLNDEDRNNIENVIDMVEDWGEYVPAMAYNTRVPPFVFVPFHEVETSVLNDERNAR